MGAGVVKVTPQRSQQKVGRPECPIVLVPGVRAEGQLAVVQLERLARRFIEGEPHRLTHRGNTKARVVLGRILDDEDVLERRLRALEHQANFALYVVEAVQTFEIALRHLQWPQQRRGRETKRSPVDLRVDGVAPRREDAQKTFDAAQRKTAV